MGKFLWQRVMLIALCAISTVSCSKDKEEDPILELSTPLVTFGQDGGDQQVTISANNSWSITEISNSEKTLWYRLTPNNGEGSAQITIHVENNPIYSDRIVKLQVRSGQLKQILTVHQPQTESTDPEVKALCSFYSKMNGPNWYKSDNWMTTQPLSTWYGVVLNAAGKVVEINLPANNIKGDVWPEELAQLQSLKNVYLQKNGLTHFPAVLCECPELRVLYLYNNQISDQLPSAIGKLKKMERMYVYSNKMTGSIPAQVGEMSCLQKFFFSANELSGALPAEFGNISSLESLALRSNHLTGTLPQSFGKLSNLVSLDVGSNSLSGAFPECVKQLSNLQSLHIDNNMFTGSLPSFLGEMRYLTVLEVQGNRFSGTIPNEMLGSAFWEKWMLIPQQTGFTFTNMPNSSDMESDDYSKDGTWYQYGKASTAKGITLVFMGDGFTSQDMGDGGRYEEVMTRSIEALFAVEPYKTYRSAFNIYVIRVVSPQNGVTTQDKQRNTALKCSFPTADRIIAIDRNIVMNYAGKLNLATRNMCISVLSNTPRHGGTAYLSAADGIGIGVSALHYQTDEIVRHEVGGHVIGLLADEYTEYNRPIDAAENAQLQAMQQLEYYLNVSLTQDLVSIRWKHFIGRSGYEGVGAFEGAYYVEHGVWRPELYSTMNSSGYPFNAPSREAIVQRICKLTGESYSFEKFLANDKIPVKSKAPMLQEQEMLPPPVFTFGSVTDAR